MADTVRRFCGAGAGVLLAACVVLAGWLAVVLTEHVQAAPRPDYSTECSDVVPPATTEVSASASIVTDRVNEVRIDTVATVKVSKSWDRAKDLLAVPDDPRRRQMLGCLLGTFGDDDERRFEEQLDSVRMVVDGQHLVFVHTAHASVTSQSSTRVGMFWVDTTDAKRWILAVVYPYPLNNTTWTSVTIDAPPAWITEPTPWPPTMMTDRQVRWAPHPPLRADNSTLIVVRLAPDSPRYQALLLADRPPWWSIRSSIATVPVLVVGVWLWWFARRHPAARARGLLHLAVPIVLLPATVIGVYVINGIQGINEHAAWPTSNWILCCAGSLAILASAALWRIRLWTVVAAGAIMASQLIAMGVLLDFNEQRQVTGLTAMTALQASHALLTIVVLFAGCLNAAGLLLGRGRPVWGQTLTWLVATLVGAVLVTERFVILALRAQDTHWLASAAPADDYVPSNLAYFVTDVLSDGLWVIAVLTVLIAAALLFDPRLGLARHRTDLLMYAALLYFTVQYWDAALWNWRLPLWLLTIPATILTFRTLRGVLDRRQANGGDLAAEARVRGLAELRTEARSWQLAIRKGRAVEKALAQGQLDAQAHLDNATAGLGDASGTRGRWRLRTWARPSRQPARVSAATLDPTVTPVDLLLAAGPSLRPFDNARYAARISAWSGIPIAVALGIYTHLSYPLPSTLTLSSAVLPTTSTTLWLAAEFVVFGAVTGAVWHHLPGRRGPIRVLPLVLLFTPVTAAAFLLPFLFGGAWTLQPLVELFLLWAVATVVGVAMDLAALRAIRLPWQRPRHMFALAYGVDTLTAQLTFLAAQASAVIAIITFIKTGGAPGGGGGGSAPAQPSLSR